MAIRIEPLRVSVPGLRAVRWSADASYAGVKARYAIGRVIAGRAEWTSGGEVLRCGPGALQLKQPGDVHRDVARDGPISFQVVCFAPAEVERVAGPVRVHAQLAPGDPRGAVFHRLHDAVAAGAPRLALEVAVAEALGALATVGARAAAGPAPARRAVRHALELLRARLADAVTLDELAAHAGVGRTQLCRAFRAHVGLSPYAYLTRLRIARAQELLIAGVAACEVPARVGLYDQSQLNRHFRRLVGTTPGRYARGA